MKSLPSVGEIVLFIKEHPGEGMTLGSFRHAFSVHKKSRKGLKHRLGAMVREGLLKFDGIKKYSLATEKGSSRRKECNSRGREKSEPPRHRLEKKEKCKQVETTGIGVLEQKGDTWLIRERGGSRRLFMLSPEEEALAFNEGDRVSFRLAEENGHLEAIVLAGMGKARSFSSITRSFEKFNDLPRSFPAKVQEEISQLEKDGFSNDDCKNREDLRSLSVLCIDPDGARDHDDAVSVQIRKDGGWELGVHIADVSEFVRKGSALDREAMERSFTRYLPWKATPMLPEELSSHQCSLVEGEDRLALSCLVEVSADGEAQNYRFTKSMVNVDRSITYEEAQNLAESDAEVKNLLNLARALRHTRRGEGFLDMDLPESRVEFDEKNEPLAIRSKPLLESCTWIEDCMLLANRCCARFLEEEELKGMYRVHEAPDPSAISDLTLAWPDLLEGSEVNAGSLVRSYRGEGNVQPQVLKLYRRMVKNTDGRRWLLYRVLRSMKKARYSGFPDGHFALGWQDYAHFTSPIRRYPDLWVHREISMRLAGKKSRPVDSRELEDICGKISEREREVMKLERLAKKTCSAWILQDRLGEEFEGSISGVESFGLFIEIADPAAEGLARFRDIAGDYFVFDESRGTLTGRRTGKVFRAGDPVRVELLRADPVRGEVDFSVLGRGGSH